MPKKKEIPSEKITKKISDCDFGTYGVFASIMKGTLYMQTPARTTPEIMTNKIIMPSNSRKRI